MRRNFLIVIAWGALLGAAWSCGGKEKPITEAAAAEPELVPVTAEGVLERVRASSAEVVLVNVWATWCLPCREEFPALVRLVREFPADRLELVLVSTDFPEQAHEARKFLADQGVTFRSYLKEGGDEEFINGLSERWSGALPATLIFDRARTLVRFWEGGASLEQFRQAVHDAAQGATGKG